VSTWPTVALGGPGYPSLLASIYDPPDRLWTRGTRLDVLAGPCVAIVGARDCSPYGASVVQTVARELADAGVVVVSGLARGIDAAAHRGALSADGATIAVLGCGVDRDYPAANAGLARRIAETGLVVSEYPPGTEPAPWRFPARKR
jgi:DNA processing protein